MPPRGTTAQHATYTGTAGELTVDTDLHQLRIHDGVKAGGWPQAHTPLNQLDDVVLSSLVDKQYLRYNAATTRWVNVSIDYGDLINVPALVQQSRLLSTSGGLQGGGDLSADRTLSIAAGGVTNTMLATMPAKTLKGNNTTGTAGAGDLTAAQVKALLAITTGDVAGLATSATTDTTNASNISAGTLSVSRLPAFTGGDVTAGAGSTALTLGNGVVTLAKMATIATNTFLGNYSGASASPSTISPSQAKTMLNIQAADIGGLSPSATVDATNASNITSGTLAPARMGTGTPTAGNVLHGDGTWGPSGNAIDTTAAYNWTGGNMWTGPAQADITKASVSLGNGSGGTVPQWVMTVPAAGTDSKIWDSYADNSGVLNWRLVNDARNQAAVWMQVFRSGITPAAVSFGMPMVVNCNISTFSPNGGGALSLVNNSTAATAYTSLDFFRGSTLSGRVRTNELGDMAYVTTSSGNHYFYSAGDAGVGAIHLAVKSTGELSMGSNVWHTSVADGQLRLLFNANSTTAFNSPANGYTFRSGSTANSELLNISATGVLSAASDVYAAGGYRWGQDTSFWIYNTGGYSYGSWRLGGNRNGYVGLVLDDAAGWHPTFMSQGPGATGVYFQGVSRWSWYDDDSHFNIQRQPYMLGSGAILRWGNGQSNAQVTVQSGGSPSGGQNGDIILIY